MAKKKQKFLIFPDGTEEKVLKETGKFYICKDRMFRKSNGEVTVKMREPEPEKEEERQEGGEE